MSLTKYEGPDGDYLMHGTMYYRCDEADTELARLRAEVHQRECEIMTLKDVLGDKREIISDRDATIARLEADARRYRYWRGLGCGAEVYGKGVILHTFIQVRNISFQAEGIDAAIDAAMSATSADGADTPDTAREG